MTYGAKLVVRRHKNRGDYSAGFASEIRLGAYEDIPGGDFGTWQGSQMSYKPFLKAVKNAHRLAAQLNSEKAVRESRFERRLFQVGPF